MGWIFAIIGGIAVGQFISGLINAAWADRTTWIGRYWRYSDLKTVAKANIDLSKYGPWEEISWLDYFRIKLHGTTWIPKIPVQGNLFEEEIYLRWTNLQIGYWERIEGFGTVPKWTHPVAKVLFWLGFGMDFKDTRFE